MWSWGREERCVKVGKKEFLVDGYEPETNTVYQYHGCHWHGHTCIENRTKNQEEKYLDTKILEKDIKEMKYNLVVVWECEKPKKCNKYFAKEFIPYPHFIVYDFEAILQALNDKQTDDLTYLSRHIPVSVAINDSLSGEPVYLVNSNPDELIKNFMQVLERKRKAIVEVVEREKPYPSDFEMLPVKVQEQWKQWVEQVPVFGFNSGKYDINMIKKYFVKTMGDDKIFVAKKENDYMFMTTKQYKFLDVKNYLAACLSYDGWCKAYDCKLEKLVFPYEWLTNYEKLDESCSSIVWKDFYSCLKGVGKEKAKEKYGIFNEGYKKRNCHTMHDWLREYNLGDVEPFIEALNKMRKTYYEDKIDLLKDAVSIPGISMTYVLNKALERDKKLELYAPGGYCNKCKAIKKELKSCEDKDSCKSLQDKMVKCKCDPTAAYELLRTGMIGGPAIVFCRYHEKDVTRIRSHIYTNGKLCKKLIGYDANSLYLYCSGLDMPCGKETLIINKKPYVEKHIKKFCKTVLNDTLFGFAQVDIEVPDELYEKFSEMSPLFVVREIPDECIPEYMKKYKKATGRKTVKGTKKLVGVMRASKILLYTPLIKWYLTHGLRITALHAVLQYVVGRPFEWFPVEVANARREGDKDCSKKLLEDTSKLKGNSFYGKMIEDLARHTNTSFTSHESDVDKSLRSPFFEDLEEIDGAYEIKERKRQIQIKRPYQCGIAVYQLAKLRMLEMYYDFLDKYFDRRDFELCYMDTDSFYIAISGESLDDIVKPEMREKYERDKKKLVSDRSI